MINSHDDIIIDAESLTEDDCTDRGAVRLVGIPQNLRSQGRVEICIGSSWGTICRDNWDDRDAAVVCNQLGYGRDGNLICSQTYEPYNSAITISFNCRCTCILGSKQELWTNFY